MNTIHNLRISVLLFFLLCVSGWGNLWAQNETEVCDTLSATAIPSAADSLFVEQLSALGIPLYSITTHNRIEPPYTPVEAPPGCCGKTIIDNEYQPARLVIIQNNATVYDTGDYVAGASGVRIKVRGNTSAVDFFGRTPYKLKFSKKIDLLNREDKNYKDKNWVLLNIQASQDFVHVAANAIGRYVREEWQPATRFVNVVLNGVPRGLYLLSESVKDGDCRLQINEGGFILEDDAYWWSDEEVPMFPSKVFYTFMKYTFKYPDEDDISEAQINRISNFIYALEDALLAGESVGEYVDLSTFASWMLCHDILGTIDAAGSNIYLYKKDSLDTSKLQAGPIWDFSGCMGKVVDEIGWSYSHYPFNNVNYNGELLKCKEFMEEYSKCWNRVKTGLVEYVISELQLLDSSDGLDLDKAYALWGVDTTTGANIRQVKEWLDNRLPWLEGNIEDMLQTGLPQGIMANTEIYDLKGKRLLVLPYNITPNRSNGFAPGCYIRRRIGLDGKVLEHKKVIVT